MAPRGAGRRRAVEYGEQIHPQYAHEFENGIVGRLAPGARVTLGCSGNWTDALREQHYNNPVPDRRRIVLAGEHASYIPAWQEGAILSSLDAIARLHERVVRLDARRPNLHMTVRNDHERAQHPIVSRRRHRASGSGCCRRVPRRKQHDRNSVQPRVLGGHRFKFQQTTGEALVRERCVRGATCRTARARRRRHLSSLARNTQSRSRRLCGLSCRQRSTRHAAIRRDDDRRSGRRGRELCADAFRQ